MFFMGNALVTEIVKEIGDYIKNGRNNMVASKQDWLKIFKLLSDSVNEANNRLNEYLQEFIDSNNHKKIIGKQNRIKTDVSFVDKLVRNNYISSWIYEEGNDEANKKNS